jgi:hypothetical protein
MPTRAASATWAAAVTEPPRAVARRLEPPGLAQALSNLALRGLRELSVPRSADRDSFATARACQ